MNKLYISTYFKKFAMLLLSLAITLVAGELIVRMFVTVRDVGPSFTVYDPVYGKRLKKNLACLRITPEFTMRFTTNTLGFRGPELTPGCRDALIFIGDSFTMGYGVSDGEEFPCLVRRALAERHNRDVPPVINAGMGSNGNGRWVKFLREEAKRYEPQLVVFQVCSNDFDDNVGEGLFRLSPSGDLIELPVPPPKMVDGLQVIIDAMPGLSYTYMVGLLRQAIHNLHSPTPRSDNDTLTYALVDRSLTICQERNWPVMFITEGIEGERLAELERRCRRFGAPLIQVPLKRQRPDLYYSVDGHWTSSGHAYVANLLVKRLGRVPRSFGRNPLSASMTSRYVATSYDN